MKLLDWFIGILPLDDESVSQSGLPPTMTRVLVCASVVLLFMLPLMLLL